MRDIYDTSVRPAHVGDAAHLARLIDTAGEGIPNWLWRQSAEPGQSPLAFGVERALTRSGGFSHKNAIMAEVFGEVVGMVLSYPILKAPTEDPETLPAPIAPFIELEKHSAGTWYVNALAVSPGYRGIGIGTTLMDEAESAARQAGYDHLSIQVYEQNIGAVRLYERLGFIVTQRARVRRHPCQPYYTGDVLLLEKRLAGTI